MRTAWRDAAILLSSLFAGAQLSASGLTIDGQLSVSKPVGSQATLELTGGIGLPAFVLADLSAGPTLLFGQNLPLGFTPATTFVGQGLTDGTGKYSTTLNLPSNPGLAGTAVYFLGVISDGGAPFGLDFSNGADLNLTAQSFTTAQLAGNSLVRFPYFEFVRAFNEGATVEVALDPSVYPSTAGLTGDVYITQARTAAEWDANPALSDMTAGGATTVTFNGADIQSNRFVVDTGTLIAVNGTKIGVGYDMVIDFNQNGTLDAGDYIDGYSDEAGLFAVHDLTQPGPYAVTEILYTGGTWLGQNAYYPSNIASLGQLPVVIVSHGNGHNYQWYDHIGYHLASYGWIVMSHQNNTVPGIETCSQTTLTNTDYFFGNLATISGGVLDGHVDKSQLIWIGHSRGGEGVARAYDKIVDGFYVPTNFSLSDIVLVSSIAPTDFLGTNSSNPHDANYHLWVGGADADVSGCVSSNVTQCFHLLDRATNQRQSISLHGVGHGDFHDGGGSSVATGPCLVGRTNTHTIMRGYILPLFRYHLNGNPAAKDFLHRQWESFHPIGAPATNPCVVVDLQFRDGAETGKFVIDDFQTALQPNRASSGGTIATTLADFSEGRMDDSNTVLTHNPSDIWNGFTQANATDAARGIVFSYDTADAELVYSIKADDADWSGFAYISFRACQGTRHPLTTSVLADQVFRVRLTDGSGKTADIGINAYGGGIEEPYQRSSCGSGVGWSNEMETVRLRLSDFRNNGSDIDLTDIAKLEFLFGPSYGHAQGRIGMDDIELTTD